jgi:hypothetical protein
MGFAAIDTFISLAKWAKVAFNLPDEPVGHSPLFFPGTAADRAFHAERCHGAILRRNVVIFFHGHFPFCDNG